MGRCIGSQYRETLRDSGYRFVQYAPPGAVDLEHPDGTRELWQVNDHHAGYTIQVGRWGYEFVRTLWSFEFRDPAWWAELPDETETGA